MPRIRINRNFESNISKYEKPFKNQASLHFSKLSKHKSFLSLKNTFFFEIVGLSLTFLIYCVKRK
jgi:hypothetical protein